MDQPQPTFSRIYEDLRRRKVVRAAALYGVVAWFAIQAAEAIFEPLNFPPYAQRLVVVVALVGFPVVIVVAWAYDLTRRGLVRTAAAPSGEASSLRERIVDFVIIGVLAALVVYLWQRPGPPTSAAGSGVRSIAVLPFDDFSEGRDQAYFGDGIAEELLNALVGVEGLRVAARTSSFAFRGADKDVRKIGQELDVDTILEGSVRRAGDRVKITAQLIETRDGYHLWSQVYDRQLTDVFAVQEDISRSIAKELKLRLSAPAAERLASAQPADVRAYDLYLLGRHHWRARKRESLERARELFAEAVRLDPEYAPAFSGLADTYLLLSEAQYGGFSPDEVLKHAEPAIARALELDGGLAEAYASLGLLRWSTGELTLAELALRKAVDLNPSYSIAHMWLGSVLIEQGSSLLAALEEYRQAYALDPLQSVISHNYASALGASGRLDEARAVVQRLVERLPGESKPYLQRAQLEEQVGRLGEAMRWVRRAEALPGVDAGPTIYRAKLEAQLGRLDEAAAALALARERGAEPLALAAVEALLDLLRGDWDSLAALADPFAPAADEPPGRGFLGEKARMALFWSAVARIGQGEFEAARERLARLELDDRTLGSAPDRLTARNAWAYALQRSGRSEEARAILERTLELGEEARAAGWDPRLLGFTLAEARVLLGQRGEALAAIEEAIGAGAVHQWYLEHLPTFDELRGDERFRTALARLEATVAEQRARADEPAPAASEG